MNYQWHYDNLIKTRKERARENGKYYERHHIIMKSMGGTDDELNLVYLTAKEHFLAHWLLWRIHRNRKTARAFFLMCILISENQKRVKIGGNAYDEAKNAIHLVGMSEESRKKCSNSRIPHEIRWLKELGTEKGEERIKQYYKALSDQVKKYHRERDKSVSRYSEEGRKKLNKSKIGVRLTDEHKKKISIKSSIKCRKLILVECPICRKAGKGGNMTRYHFNNCKYGK